ncbi:MauE/DoxX family redox-associated membrane protein [Thiomicrorhabdus sp.]|uniref:MauE/DoxX family redox-associated membrane protein n=1 Tax=Thiomicrorhabdus sp. TaxID=2039724 RepID=UPI0035651C5B
MSEIIPYLNLACLVFIILLMLKAALHKAFDFLEFQGFVADYELIPEKLIKPFSAALVGLELASVGMMLVNSLRDYGLMLAIALFIVYAIAIGINLLRGRTSIECGCGGAPQLLGPVLIWRNALLVLAAALPLAGIPENMSAPDILIAMAAGIFLWTLYSLFEQTNANLIFLKSKKI